MTRILNHKLLQVILSALIVSVAALCIFTPDIFVFKQGANFTVQIMFANLLLAMFFLILDQRRLMFISLAACGVLALYLKGETDQSLKFPSNNENPHISVAHIDLSLSEDFNEAMHTILIADVDLISFQEYTPIWDEYLSSELTTRYPYRVTMKRIDPYGKAIFSKFPLSDNDTMNFEGFDEIPSLHTAVMINDYTEIHVISTHTVPPVNERAYERIRDYFHEIGIYVGKLEGPVITLGDFSLPGWSNEIKEFKEFANLSDSRRDVMLRSTGYPIFFFNIPIDHIFYSNDFECTAFNSISGDKSSHMGISGKYQLKALASLEPGDD
jgi:endonuclease/exonuclease/phosphatase (EEP) superfamily protein YafD